MKLILTLQPNGFYETEKRGEEQVRLCEEELSKFFDIPSDKICLEIKFTKTRKRGWFEAKIERNGREFDGIYVGANKFWPISSTRHYIVDHDIPSTVWFKVTPL